MQRLVACSLALALFAACATQSEPEEPAVAETPAGPPQTSISNGVIDMQLYLPDAENGYYQGTRFDWSGVVHSLTYAGHEFFGEWREYNEENMHDRITGPVEEFVTDMKGLGYDEAEVGGEFIRIGVGVCEKPEEEDFNRFKTYEIVDGGEWTVDQGENWIEFTHVLSGGEGYGYRYVKRLTLPEGEPHLVITHTLENTGEKRIDTEVYNHNFFVIDGRPTGPEFTVRLGYEAEAYDSKLEGIATVEGDQIVFAEEIPEGQSIITFLRGFGDTPEHHRFEIENSVAGVGVRAETDQPLSQALFWAPRTTLCPEGYSAMSIEPGASHDWTTRYEFYETD